KPSPEMLEPLTERNRALGGISPLATIPLEQAKKLEKRLKEVQDEVENHMYLGIKHNEPFIEDAEKDKHNDGIQYAIA
ncbi:ferrochelatase, partial [Bacillus cereus]|nr:ferrochelatase [Bacillus cereus]